MEGWQSCIGLGGLVEYQDGMSVNSHLS